MKTTIINLYGGPGAGKSTTAAEVFAELKKRGEEVELVREYAKDLVWEGRPMTKNRQFYMFGKQSKRELDLYGKVKYIVTDSPLFLSHIYFNLDQLGKKTPVFNNIFLDVINEFKKVNPKVNERNFLLHRTKKYNPNGRNQTENEANQLDEFIKHEFLYNNDEYVEINGNCNEKATQILKFLEVK